MEISQLNEAKAQDLEKIEGIGHQRAQDIVNYREENGDFESWDDVKKIPGFSEEMVDVLRTNGADWGEDEEDIQSEE